MATSWKQNRQTAQHHRQPPAQGAPPHLQPQPRRGHSHRASTTQLWFACVPPDSCWRSLWSSTPRHPGLRHACWKCKHPLSLPAPFIEWYQSQLLFGPRLMATCANCPDQFTEHAQILHLTLCCPNQSVSRWCPCGRQPPQSGLRTSFTRQTGGLIWYRSPGSSISSHLPSPMSVLQPHELQTRTPLPNDSDTSYSTSSALVPLPSVLCGL